MGWPRRLATAASLLTGALAVLGAVLAALAPSPAAFVALAVMLAVSGTSAVLGLLVGRRWPDHLVGLWLAFLGLALAMVATKEIGVRWLAEEPGRARRLDWLVALTAENLWMVFAAVGLLLLSFPTGRLPGPRWRWVPWALVGCALANQAYGAVEDVPFRAPLADLPNPFGPPPAWVDVASFGPFVALLGLVLATVVSLVQRYRRAEALERRQLRWLALAGTGIPLYPLLCLAELLLWGRTTWLSGTVGIAALVAVPAGVGVAMLRHDLYDVDKALAVTVTWAAISALLLGIYAAASATAGTLAGRSPALAAALTAVAALLLAPLRTRLQRAVDRRLYPLRPAAFEALETLQRDAGAGRARPEELEAVLRAALRDPLLRMGFRVPGSAGFVAADGSPVPAGGVPVMLGGEPVGVLVPGGGLASAELLREVADRATTLVEVVRLRLELAGALRDVESSRARLLQTGYEERRRLERDLHDGAQQRLVSLGMAIRLAQRHLHDGTVDVDGLLDQSVAELGTAVAELRQIARGLRPSSLDDGLPAALAGLVRSVPVVVDMDVCPDPVPDDVATTAYYVVSEAVANAVKHAEASRIRLRITRDGADLLVTVVDDGRGGATLHPASAIADRVAALGGRLHVVSPAGRGTTVEAALPCAS